MNKRTLWASNPTKLRSGVFLAVVNPFRPNKRSVKKSHSADSTIGLRLYLYLLVLLLLPQPPHVSGQSLDQGYIDFHNPLTNGIECHVGTLQAALTAIGATQRTLYLTATNRNKVECTWNISSNVTIPANVRFVVPFGVKATIPNGVTLTINGCLDAQDPNWYSGGGVVIQTGSCFTVGIGDSIVSSFTQVGCYHGASNNTSVSIPDCTGFIASGSGISFQSARLVYPVATTINYNNGDGSYYTVARRDYNVTPSGWTCTPNSPYCFIKSLTKPVLPTGTMWLLLVTVSGSKVTQSEDISYRIISTSGTVTSNTTIGIDGVWEIQPGASININSGSTVTVKGCITAPIQKIFNGPGLVRYADKSHCSQVYAEWWGARGDGVAGNQEVVFTLASEALPFGGTILGAGSTAHYIFDDQWNIRSSNLTFDGRGCLFSSTSPTTLPRIRAWDGGGRSVSGETGQFLHNVHLRNYRVGIDPLTNTMRGGALHGCVNCSIENVVVNITEGTAFNLFRAQSSVMRNVHIVHGGGDESEFCTLLVHSNNTLVDNWSCRGANDGTGPCCNALQVKGGIGNTISNTLVENLKNPEELKRAYWSRGDAPWTDSNTDPDLNPYPFPTNGALNCKVDNCYSVPDPRRATQHTQWINNKVKNVYPGHCWAGQEGYGDSIVNFYGEDCRAGIVYNQSTKTGSGERDLTISNFHLKNTGLDAATGDGLYAISILGAGSASEDGQAVAATNFQNIAISSGIIDSSAGPGVGIRNASNVTVHNVTIKNAAQKAVSEPFGIYVAGMNRDNKFIGNRIIDDMNPPKMTGGLRIAENVIAPTAIGNSIICTNCVFGSFNAIRALPVGRYAQNTPAFCTALTTDATPDHQRCVLLTKSGDRFKILSSCVARQGTTNRGYYERTAIVEDNGGVLTIYSNVGTGDITFESDPTWDVTYAAVLEELRIRPQGGVGQNVEWYCDVETISLIP